MTDIDGGGVAVVTGGASGFGRALGERCAAGLQVVVLDRDGSGAESVAAAIAAAHGVNTLGLRVDVADKAAVDWAAATVRQQFGRADLLISNVGVQLFGAVERLADDEWRWVSTSTSSVRPGSRALPPAASRRTAGTIGVHGLVVGARARQLDGRLPSEQVRGVGPGRHPPAGAPHDGITVSVIFPSGMITRHLETSETAQPEPRDAESAASK